MIITPYIDAQEVKIGKSLYHKGLGPKCIKMKIVVDNRVKALYNGIHDRD